MQVPIRFMTAAVAAASILMAQTRENVLSKLRGSTAESQTAAASGLAEFKRLVNSTNFQSYGFQSPDEATSATLGQPAVAFLVRLDQLRQYQQSVDPVSLLSGGDKVLYPVLARGQVRSSIIIDKGSGGWKAVSFGGSQLIQRLARARDKVSGPGTPTVEVEILALSAYFLGEFRSGVLFLTPLANQPELNLTEGATAQAAQVLARLVPAARAYNGQPR
jgi:hypothetical protein